MPVFSDDYSEYLYTLKTNYRPAIKIEWMNNDGSSYGEITNSYVDMSGTVSVSWKTAPDAPQTLNLTTVTVNFPLTFTICGMARG